MPRATDRRDLADAVGWRTPDRASQRIFPRVSHARERSPCRPRRGPPQLRRSSWRLIVALAPLSLAAPRPTSATIVSAYASAGREPVAPGVQLDQGRIVTTAGSQAVNFVEVDPSNPAISFEASTLQRTRGRARADHDAGDQSLVRRPSRRRGDQRRRLGRRRQLHGAGTERPARGGRRAGDRRSGPPARRSASERTADRCSARRSSA